MFKVTRGLVEHSKRSHRSFKDEVSFRLVELLSNKYYYFVLNGTTLPEQKQECTCHRPTGTGAYKESNKSDMMISVRLNPQLLGWV